ncbi:ROK family protein [Cohnella sp. CFH 77786]|uniref:ROK family protein n=1 Tax=Cohnella sp. CFH 77786 TaxID=2662265 RepID=UPI001C61116F|nr:ROK family protein [Cohnella sp. CFH 77786]MBW5445583.1 ROK family protein [Cohnella sp. CFH 77786]
MGRYAFGVDVGGTNIECGIVRPEGTPIWRSRVRTEPRKGNEHVMALIAGQVREGLRETGIPAEDVLAVGVGMPGLVEPLRGVSIRSTNLFFRDYPVAAKLMELTGLPVYIENDVKLYVYGESCYGAGRGYRHVLGLTLGTGLAAALVNDGRLYNGSGCPGEIGHIPIDEIPYPCGCGLTGCLETAVSATGLVRQAVSALADGSGDHADSLLAKLYPDLGQLTAKDISDAYDQGDALAVAIMERSGRLLGRTLSYIVPMVSPDVILVGGGAAQAGDRLLGPAKETLYASIMPVYRENLAFVTGELGSDAGVLGSAKWAFDRSAGE